MEVSVIIVNYNTYSLTKECIESVIKYSTNIIEIIVIDNASKDASKNNFSNDKRINYLYLNENRGFGAANNVGAAIAKGKYLFFLNSDTVILYDIIQKLYRFCEDNIHLKIGALGTCLVDSEYEDVMSFGQFHTSKRIYRRMLENIPKMAPKYETEIYQSLTDNYYAKVDFISGADLFVRRDVFQSIEGFDKRFFMYYEETDLQKRLEQMGYMRYIINERGIIHLESGSFGHDMKFNRKLLITESLKIYIDKHFFGFKKIEFLFLLVLITLKDLLHLKYNFNQNIIILKTLLK